MLQPSYLPSDEIVERYARLLVRFALWGGQGIRPGDVVQCVLPEHARQFYEPLRNEILRAGGHPLMDFNLIGVNRSMYEIASDAQLDFVMGAVEDAMLLTVDARITIMPSELPGELEGVDQKKVTRRKNASSYAKRFGAKVARGEATRTLASWGVEELAREVGLTLEEYWRQVIYACCLDDPDPIARWTEIFSETRRICAALDALEIDGLHIEGDDVDFRMSIGEHRQWRGGSGANIPSYEVFTTPDWRTVEGWIRFNLPLYRNGVKIDGIQLRFAGGEVVEATATSNSSALQAILDQPSATRIGEISLTDSRSRITHPMARTVFDENMGGPQGNTHIALGSGYRQTYDGDVRMMDAEKWAALGFNDPDAKTHVDVVSTSRRKVTAFLMNGSQMVIYADGKWRV